MELLKKSQTTTTSTVAEGGTLQQATTKTVVEKLKKKKKRNRWIWISLAALALIIIVLMVVKGGKEKTITVQVETASRRTITEVVQATGKIQPEFKVKIAPEVSGEIIALPFKEGARVRKGQLLAKIKPTSFQAQYNAAVSQLQGSKSRVEQMKAQFIQAELTLKRTKELQSKGLASASELEQAQAQYDISNANVKAAQFDVAATQSQLQTFAESLRKTTVASPMSGVITQLISQLGEKVVGTSQFSGTEMMTVSDLSVMNAEVEVDENDVVNVSIGDTARLTIDAFPGRTFTGTVVEIANSAKLKGVGTQDQSTNFAVKIRLYGFEEGELRPGMSCTAKIETETRTNVIAVPIMAVTRRSKEKAVPAATDMQGDEQQVSELAKKAEVAPKQEEAPTIVFIVENGKAKSVPVKTGISDNSYVEILSGIKGTEDVIKGNYAAVSKELQEGSAVRIEGSISKSKTPPKK